MYKFAAVANLTLSVTNLGRVYGFAVLATIVPSFDYRRTTVQAVRGLENGLVSPVQEADSINHAIQVKVNITSTCTSVMPRYCQQCTKSYVDGPGCIYILQLCLLSSDIIVNEDTQPPISTLV